MLTKKSFSSLMMISIVAKFENTYADHFRTYSSEIVSETVTAPSDFSASRSATASTIGLAMEATVSQPSTSPTYLESQSTLVPSISPMFYPTSIPTGIPTRLPSRTPSVLPSFNPTNIPTSAPTKSPTALPSSYPSTIPSNIP